MRILFAARSFDQMAGGVERMVLAISSLLAQRGHSVSVLTWDTDDAKPFYSFNQDVRWHRINWGKPDRKATVRTILKRMYRVRRILRMVKPEVIVAFQGGTFFAIRVFGFGCGSRFVAAERNAPTLYKHTSAGLSGERRLYRILGFAHKIVVQCEEYVSMYPKRLREKCIVIPNPVELRSEIADPGTPTRHGRYTLLAVGRLSYQKNFDCLIRAFSLLTDAFPLWDLLICGEGEERDRLTSTIDALKLSSRVSMPGNIVSIGAAYGSAQLFCLPSRWEGFPNALAEAMASGLPSVGFQQAAGINVLIKPGETGLLAAGCGDPQNLAVELAKLMGDSDLRRRFGKAAVQAVSQYSPDRVTGMWEEVLACKS